MIGHGSRGPSPLRPGLMSGQASFRPEEMSPIGDDMHPVIHAGRVAVITGAASGIGRAAAKEMAKLGLRIAIADVNEPGLAAVGEEITAIQKSLPEDIKIVQSRAHSSDGDSHSSANLLIFPTDVSKADEVVRLRDRVYEAWGEVAVLLNNAGIGSLDGKTGTSWDGRQAWDAVFAVNLFGVLNVQQTFVPSMVHQENNAMIINTGSKQGITNPPGNAAYNATKAAVKSMTEGLAHELRQRGENVTAHLFVPGWTHTTIGGAAVGSEKPAGAWSAEETVLYMFDRVRAGDFYVLCPDNETRPEVDALRIMWAAGDITEGRPALSRWHPTYKSLFEEYMRESLAEMQ